MVNDSWTGCTRAMVSVALLYGRAEIRVTNCVLLGAWAIWVCRHFCWEHQHSLFNLFCLLSDKKGFQCGTPDLNWTDLSSSWSIRVRHICEEFPHERAGPCCLCAGVERTVLSGQCHPSTSYCTTRHKLCTFHWTFAQLQLFDNLNYSSLYNFRVTVKNTFLICKQIPLFHYRLSSNTTSVS